MESVYVFAFLLGPTNVSLKFQGDVFIFKVFILGDMSDGRFSGRTRAYQFQKK